ncbi:MULTISPECIES: hypothetical protein [unclassified Pseudomonas]|uniref:hypothetical protein n=1 Tax=unclassified Pseudomonas TaxID=196821 RepID=UPI000881E67B|nr:MULTISPECIES: hypothetical protein [unclassified Pseudomonas]SDA91775.1 hypothetical protein SAMN03159429_06118 [Pseudomonas sp. NFACC51]SDW40463.1 hypothetical protein SAMN03159474_00781 [Pseudomonas sp. NFACC08-1]SFJ53373.1 hypothetical protein SAMN03159302_06021 [Pseudomonas sp. NFACC54]SFT30844.1 hypothetical protein SAMN03159306_06115 [Pseudomonas sp. NFACC48-1]
MSVVLDQSGVSTLVGTPKEVRARLSRSHADRVLVVSFDHIKPNVFEALAENFANVAFSMYEVLQERQDLNSLERLAEVFVSRKPPSPRLLKEAAMLVQARKAVLGSGDWLTAADIAQVAQLSTRNPSAQPNKWKKQGQIFAINHGGVDYFPGYGLDPDANYRPLKALAKVIEVFEGHKDSWGMAYWFRSDNSFLGGKKPQDLLASAPDRVIGAAQDENRGIAHG